MLEVILIIVDDRKYAKAIAIFMIKSKFDSKLLYVRFWCK